ncbi:OmpH family outer membrane protein [Fervidibacter sacchari]|uniref:Skp family chaperone for outer membrane proteins n=1 Tax=Candidatus Fervidibacter sacchari TaxID=1448929 RepID=A0ABT2EN64_9BACT|nr:OmpH family outer membrane protein [Candidatus Fervidibacter sacchari]MCS3919290.1 Skp family chaperone for outer membrane proteins [Candidatus Fervidibacter sacchari]WKU15030.1 OmpH family outer membrane protein [Candidatus Fervidibacter sacchari]
MRRVLVAALVVSALTVLVWQKGLPTTQGQLKVGVLNIAKISREVQNIAELRRTFDEQRRAYLELINLRQNFLMLTGLEWADLRRLLSRPQRTKSDEQRIQELRRISFEREAELQRLQQTPPDKLSPQERSRLEQLVQIWREGRADVERLKSLMDEELKRLEEQLNKLVDEKLQEAVRKVADQQGLDLVLDRSVVYFVRGDCLDVTDAVLSVLTEALKTSEKSPESQTTEKEAKPQ